MQLKSKFKSWLGGLLFLTGVVIGLVLSAFVTWGETEAYLYTFYNSDARFTVKCPHMLAPTESGIIQARITNITKEDIKPVVTAQISHGDLPRQFEQTVPLLADESKTVKWTVVPSDVIFGDLILVNILQSRYRDNPSFLGSCGIILFHVPGLTGMQSFILIMAVSLVAMLGGGMLWLTGRRQPLSEFSVNFMRINKTLMTITVLTMLSTLPRWWGFTLFFDALILLVMAVIFTDFVLLSKYKN
jgi:hypothetical protein